MDAHKIGSYTDIDSKEETAISDCLYEEIRLDFVRLYPLDKKINHSIYQSEKFFYYLFAIYFFPEYLTSEICERLEKGINEIIWKSYRRSCM